MLTQLARDIYSIWIHGKSIFTFKTHCTRGILQRIKEHTILQNFQHFKLVGLKDIILTSIEPLDFWWHKLVLHPFSH